MKSKRLTAVAIIVAVYFFIGFFATVQAAPPEPPGGIQPLFDAIQAVESGGERNPAIAVGDNGRSLGPYQISRKYWYDATHRPTGNGNVRVMEGNYSDVQDEAYARRVMLSYWQRYCPAALAQLDYETLARVHNGGPGGYALQSTLAYWQKILHNL